MGPAATESYASKARRHVRSPADVLLLARMTSWCLALRVLKHVLPLDTLVSLARFGVRFQRPVSPKLAQRASEGGNQELHVVVLSRWVARFTRLSDRGPCLERSLVTYRYLVALGAQPRLVVGVAAGEVPGDPMRGHAWVVLDGVALDETAQSLAGFQSVVAFEADGHRLPA